MFKPNQNSKATTVDANAPDKLNRIVEGTSIQGEINSESNIRIDGHVKGTITTKGRLVIGVTGSVEGEINCQNAEIEGSINGTLKVEDLLSLKSTAKIIGDIITSKLAIESGAEFSGTCNMSGNIKNSNAKGRILSQDIESSVKEILEETTHN
jgi:cytoskeletal protein CcmA (bactofilin family)